MDMDHAKITVTVRRVAGKQGAANVSIEGPLNLLLTGLAMLIWKLAKETGQEPEALCDIMKPVLSEDRLGLREQD